MEMIECQLAVSSIGVMQRLEKSVSIVMNASVCIYVAELNSCEYVCVCVVTVSLGYKGVFVARNTKEFCEGEATFYRANQFVLESSESLLLNDVISQV